MDRKDAIAWVLSVCDSLRLRQAKAVSQRVVEAKRSSRIFPAAFGRWPAYQLVCGPGLLALETCPPRPRCSNNRPGERSVFVIGQHMLDRLHAKPPPNVDRPHRFHRTDARKQGVSQVCGGVA